MSTAELQAALPDYEITKELGRGAMGIVYLGRHRALNRQVAIKELPPSFAADDTVRRRFLTEARVVASLDHPHVVVIHDFVDRDGHLALVMEHLPNGTVWDQFLSKGLAAPRACGLVLATLAGVHHAHDRGVMHRDIKPENLIFTHDWQLKVTDFGIAQVLTGTETMSTVEGAIVGTPAYMSPEQAEGRTCGPPADVYASGAMLYEMLTGKLPFPNAESALAMATARLKEDPVPITSVGPPVPGAIAEVAMHALARNERDRFSSAEEFGVALAEAAADTWGIEWMTEAGTSVRGSAAIEQASRTTRGASMRARTSQGDHPGGSADGGPPPPAVDPRATRIDATAVGPIDAPMPAPVAHQPTSPMPTSPMPVQPVVPDQPVRLAVADLNQLVPEDMLNLAEVRMPRSPALPAAVALVALVAAVLIMLSGIGSNPTADNATGIVIDGQLVRATGDPAEVDLTAPFTIDGVEADTLSATFLGIPVGSATIEDGVVDPGYLRYSAAGVIELSLNTSDEIADAATTDGSAADTSSDTESNADANADAAADATTVPIRSTNSVYPTAPFVVAAMVALGGLGSVQSNLRAMRARRIRVAPFVGLAVSGAVAAAGLSVLAMLVLSTPTNIGTIALAAPLAALGCVALGETYRRWRRRRRLQKITVATGRR